MFNNATKCCAVCRMTKPISEYSPLKGQPRSRCRACSAVDAKRWRGRNREAVRAQKRRAYARNPQAKVSEVRRWRARNPEKVKEQYHRLMERRGDEVRRRHLAWKRSHPEAMKAAGRRYYAAHRVKCLAHVRARQAAKLRALPVWADRKKMAEIYARAQILTIETGIPYEVDHIVPLVSQLVCGLHCEANLRPWPRLENRRKHNLTWPDMP